MSAIAALTAIILTCMVTAVGIAVRRFGGSWWRFRGTRVITCPENQRSAAVVVDAGHAATTGWRGVPELRLSGCSRWPERVGCGQECLSQIRSAPDECLVLSILTQWYEGKYCVSCGQPVSRAYWTRCNPALLVGGLTKEWDEIAPAQLPETLAAAQPICFHCHIQHELAGASATQAISNGAAR